jgi:hypothetical protein
MPTDWKRVTKAEPCPVCKKGDWCAIGARYINCMRVMSAKVCQNGGWLHDLGAASQPLPPRQPKEPTVDVRALLERWDKWTNETQIERLARLLHVDMQSLLALNVVWAEEHDAWAFPMVDAACNVTGVRLRNEKGEKWAVRGGKNGVFLPKYKAARQAYICEGPTDTAALLSIGLFAIGRPSCNEGAAILSELLPRLGVRTAVIVGDHDTDKERPDGTTYNPGVDGSVRLSEALPIPNCVWIPPTKDARDFVNRGGTCAAVEEFTKGARWNRPRANL